MLTVDDIRGYIAGLGEYNMVYIGKMDNKREHSIGVYPCWSTGIRMYGPQNRRPMNYLRNLEMYPA